MTEQNQSMLAGKECDALLVTILSVKLLDIDGKWSYICLFFFIVIATVVIGSRKSL